MQRIGIWELLIILVIVLLIFGPKKLPEISRAIGDAIREFKKSLGGVKDAFKDDTKDDGQSKKG